MVAGSNKGGHSLNVYFSLVMIAMMFVMKKSMSTALLFIILSRQ